VKTKDNNNQKTYNFLWVKKTADVNPEFTSLLFWKIIILKFVSQRNLQNLKKIKNFTSTKKQKYEITKKKAWNPEITRKITKTEPLEI